MLNILPICDGYDMWMLVSATVRPNNNYKLICILFLGNIFLSGYVSGATHMRFLYGCLSGSLIDGHVFLSGYLSGTTHMRFVCGCLSGSLIDGHIFYLGIIWCNPY